MTIYGHHVISQKNINNLNLKLKNLNSTQGYLSNELSFVQIEQGLIFDHIWASRGLECVAYTADTLKY